MQKNFVVRKKELSLHHNNKAIEIMDAKLMYECRYSLRQIKYVELNINEKINFKSDLEATKRNNISYRRLID